MYSNNPAPRILFVRPKYGTRLAERGWLSTEPLDLEYLAAIANEQDCVYAIHDPVVTNQSFARAMDRFKPNIVAISGYYPAKNQMLDYASQAKRKNKNILTLIGGVHAEVNPADFHHGAVDIVVHSGGAITFRNILTALRTGNPPSDIDGICHPAKNGEWNCRGKVPFNPAALPLPDRSHFNKHREHFTYLHHGPVALLKTAYGCPFDCTFCYCRMLNDGQHTERVLAEVVAEIKGIECNKIWIVDDLFLIDTDRIRSFIALLKQEEIRKEFIIYSRSEFIAKNPAVVPLLKEAGVIDVIVGFETIDERKLDEYGKRSAEGENRRCIHLLKDVGIECTGLFIMDVDATRSDFHALDQWIKKVGLTTYTLSIFTPYPGTETYEEYKDKLTTSDCRKWDLSHLVMKPTRMSRFSFYVLVLGMHLKLLARNRDLRRFVFSRMFRPPKKNRNIWDFWADRYESLWVQRFSLGPTRREIIKNIPAEPDMNLLDMGCGTGQLFGDLKEHFKTTPFSYRGIDQSAQMVEAARTKHPDGTFTVASAAEYHVPAKTYDVIVCAHSFPYFPAKNAMIRKLEKMLKDGGILILAQASMNNLYDAAALSVVKLTTTKAHYPSRHGMCALAEPAFGSAPEETRVGRNFLIPSIYLFKWIKTGSIPS